MTFAADMLRAERSIKAKAGESALFYPGGLSGTPEACNVDLDTQAIDAPQGYPSSVSQLERTLEVVIPDLSRAPQAGDVFVVGTETVTLTPRVLENDGRIFRAVVK